MMKTIAAKTVLLANLICLASFCVSAQPKFSVQPRSNIPTDQLGAVAGKQYEGSGQSICVTPKGARVRCMFQRLEGEATANGLWLRSTAEGSTEERFRVMAVGVGRGTTASLCNDWLGPGLFNWPQLILSLSGDVEVAEGVARFLRGGLTEEYSVSMDGVRQDFIVQQRPPCAGKLHVELDVTGATAEPLVNGARLTLNGSGRKLAYNRLNVTDASGRELRARIEVISQNRLVVLVDDADAVFPVRIDPTFSDADWISMGGIPGADNQVLALAVAGSDLYVGGSFTNVGAVVANGIAKWNGTSWSALASGMNATVRALAISGNDLYVGGDFTTATNSYGAVAVNRIAKWDGSSWSALGAGVNNPVWALAVSGTDLYAGGQFTTAGGIIANRIAKWNGNNWSALGAGMNNTVLAITASGGDIYAGGSFTTSTNSGNVTINTYRIAKWDGSSWSALASGMNGTVRALSASGDDLYVGGDFTTATNSGGAAVTANQIAKWDGSSWSALGSGLNSLVTAMGVAGNDLYAGGFFTTATNNGGVPITVNFVAKWNGTSWSALGSGLNSVSSALAVSGNDLFAGGNFTGASGRVASRIAKWNGSAWSALDSRLNNEVYALAVAGSDLYAGGEFTTGGGSAVNRIAKWNGSSWSAVGLGLNGYVNGLAVSGTNLYAGGLFTRATNSGGGTVTVNGVAKWNGSSWSALGSGMNNQVWTLAVSGTDLYAGGEFTTAGGILANRIAKWNGNSWSALGLGIGNDASLGAVHALAVSGNDLYAAGGFLTAGGSAANSIAKWNGNEWSPLGSGVGDLGYVRALAVSVSNLYAGGMFTTAGGITVHSIAKWNGSSWSALGSGLNDNGRVYALGVSGSDLYVGGDFTTVTNSGGVAVPVNRIAKWDGNSWSALGSGLNSNVWALAVSGGDLYAGGSFTTAGGKASAYIAKANIGRIASTGRFSGSAFSPSTGFSCNFLDASVGQNYRIQISPSLATGNWIDFTNFTYTGPIVIADPTGVSVTNRFFRAVSP